MNLKRLWDTENKEMVWAIPTGDPHKKLQVWTNDDGSKLYVYDMAQYLELDTSNVTVSEYGPVWKALDDEMVGYYLTNVPTELYNWDEGDEVSYTFKDWDGTVLKTGKVEEGTAPTPPADPTREATAQYTYTFAGWNPEVGAISKRTTYTATYTATVNQYTVTISSNNTDYGTVDESTVTVDYGTAISANENVLTIGDTEVTATANTDYQFSTWGELPATVTGATSITATFEHVPVTVTFTSKCIDSITEEEVVGGQTATFSQNSITVPVGTTGELIWSGEEIIGYSFSTGDSVTWTTPVVAEGYGYTTDDPTPSGDIELDGVTGEITVNGDGNIYVKTWRYAVVSISIESNDESMGTVDIESIYGVVGSSIGNSDNTLTIGGFIDNQLNDYTVTATPETLYAFKEWQGLPEGDIEEPITITAVFEGGR